jgi:hypothetical protein
MKERTAKQRLLDAVTTAAMIAVLLGGSYGILLGIAAARGGSNPHSDDPCASTYQGPPAECIPHDPSGVP